jgi:predicted TIM-barrel fold metal-dependent hydrolase
LLPGAPITVHSSGKQFRQFDQEKNSKEVQQGEDEMASQDGKLRWSLKGCVCGCEDAISLTGATLSRRQFVAGMGAVTIAAAGATGMSRALAQNASPKPYRIDVHHHLSPPSYVAASVAAGFGEAPLRKWTPEQSIADMDKAGIAVAMLSVTTPGVNFTSGETAGKLARECNEYAAKLISDHPGRFGGFAMLPLTDIDASLQEISYALDTLKLDGIGLLTSYHDKWLGDPAFLPVMEELNRRKVVVYTHPTAADCCVNLVRTQPPVMIEFGTDTTRAIADIIFSGNAQKFRDIRWIFSHAGGTMPFLIERLVRHPTLDPKAKPTVPDGTLAELRRFWYDTAQTANKAAMSALAAIIPPSQIVFGTDFPYRTGIEQVNGLRNCGVFTEAQIADIERGNALKLLPRLNA